jgi:hypothetical protein
VLPKGEWIWWLEAPIYLIYLFIYLMLNV